MPFLILIMRAGVNRGSFPCSFQCWARRLFLTPFARLHALVQVRILVHTDVTKYLEFKGVDGSYVLNKGRVEKVPATDYEALRSPLLGLFEKRRLRSFLLCALAPERCALHCVIVAVCGLRCRPAGRWPYSGLSLKFTDISPAPRHAQISAAHVVM